MTTQTQDIAARLDELEQKYQPAQRPGRCPTCGVPLERHIDDYALTEALWRCPQALRVYFGYDTDDVIAGRVTIPDDVYDHAQVEYRENAIWLEDGDPDVVELIATYRAVLAERDRYREALELVIDFHGAATEQFVARYGHGMTTRDLCDRIRAALVGGDDGQ